MAKSSITSFDVQRVQEKTGFLKQKTTEDEILRMETSGGSIYLRKSAVRECRRQLAPCKAPFFQSCQRKKHSFHRPNHMKI